MNVPRDTGFVSSDAPAATGVAHFDAEWRRALNGKLAAPIASSRGRGWRGIVVEQYHLDGLDVVAQSTEHVVTLQLAGSSELCQTRAGQSARRVMRVGDITITPAGEPRHWQLAGQIESAAAHLNDALRIDTAFWIREGEALEKRFDRWAPQICKQQTDEDEKYEVQALCQDVQGNMQRNESPRAHDADQHPQ